MGECGCGETRPYKIVEIGGNVMVVEIYRGCEYCDTGLIVSLHLHTPESATDFDFVPEEKFEPGEYGTRLDFPLLSGEDLAEAARQMKADEYFGGNGYDSMTDWLDDYGLELLQRAVRLRLTQLAQDSGDSPAEND
jgi:hypothetical protein